MRGKRRYIIGLAAALIFSISGGTLLASGEKKLEQEVTKENMTEVRQIQTMEELIKILQEKNHFRDTIDDGRRYFMREGASADLQGDTDLSVAGSRSWKAEAVQHSVTNTQVKDVDEADRIKTDERYIYTCFNNQVVIIDTKDKMKQVASISLDDPDESYYQVKGFFLDQQYLTVLTQSAENNKLRIRYDGRNNMYTTIRVYDVKKRSCPKLIRRVKTEGYLKEVRKTGHQIYMITQKETGWFLKDHYDRSELVPGYLDSVAGNKLQPVEVKGIRYCPWSDCNQYTMITTFNIGKKEKARVITNLSSADDLYMNEKAIYLVNSEYGGDGQEGTYGTTFIMKYNIKGSDITYVAANRVKGHILNQFSMDEYQDYFRIATSSQDQSGNNVYILDKNLKMEGRLEGFGKDEKIYSVRFEGPKGYVVTFQQIDPLFALDLSKPQNPQIAGKLKVPGFSQYLHPIEKNLMVGIGRSTEDNIIRDEEGNEEVTGVYAAGLKLSLFDVKDPENPKELDHITLGKTGYSEALENHKAVMVNKEKKLLAIPVRLVLNKDTDSQTDRDQEYFSGAYIFGVEKGKLVVKAKLSPADPGIYYDCQNGRICYIGNNIYYVYGDQVSAYNMDNFKCVQTLTLQ